jgi:TrmH family RNA methyltransferase
MGLPVRIEKEVRRLHKKKYRKEMFKYILEGIICVNELLQTDILPEYAIISDDFGNKENEQEILNKLKTKNIEIFSVSENYFNKLVNTVSPQGIFCVAPMKFKPIESVFDKEESVICILDRLTDPGNLGTLVRSASAFGISGMIILACSVELYNPKVMRSALGAHFHLPILYDIEFDMIYKTLENKGYKFYAAVPDRGIKYYEIDKNKDKKIAFIIGNEHHGVHPKILEYDKIEKFNIPINPKIESLNAAVTGSIIMSYFSRFK